MSDEFFSEKYVELTPYVPGEQPRGLRGLIKLNTNENPYPPSKKAIKAGEEAAKRLNLYSDPTGAELRLTIATYHGLSPENVVLGNGSDECLSLLFAGFCDGGAAFPDVTYGFYKVLGGYYGVKIDVVPLKSDFTVGVEDYEGIKRTVFIANPNAPTGIALSADKIAVLAAQDEHRLVVVDEAYVDFGGETAAGLIKTAKNVVVVRTFSKSRSLAGGRLGYILAPENIARDLERLRNSLNPYNVNSVTLAMGKASVADDAYFRRNLERVIAEREKTADGLRKIGFKVLKSAANFLFVSPPGGDGKRLYEELRARNILVRYFDTERLKAFCRISVGDKNATNRLLAAACEIYRAE